MSKTAWKHSGAPVSPRGRSPAVRVLLSAGAAERLSVTHCTTAARSSSGRRLRPLPGSPDQSPSIQPRPRRAGQRLNSPASGISPFHIKKNATVTVSFGPTLNPPPTLTFKFKINAIAQDGETFDLSGKQVAASGQADGKSLGLSKSITHLEIKNGVPDSCTATFINPPGQKTSTLVLTFGPGPA